jgi:predicted HAD superfamily Cof-like phosphohydrolase
VSNKIRAVINECSSLPQSEVLKLIAGLAAMAQTMGPDELSNFDAVGAFHQRFGLDVTNGRSPHHIPVDLSMFRVAFLQEELNELIEAYNAQDLPKIADSLVDLVYVALGTAHLHGFPWEELFAEVQRANMQKVRAQRPEDSTRLSTFDVVKPAGWQPPNIIEVLMRAGWKGPALPMSE